MAKRYEPSLLAKYLGDTPPARVLDYFLMNKRWDASMQDVADWTGLSRNTVKRFVQYFERLNVLRFTRSLGRAKLYHLSEDNPAIDHMIELDMKLSHDYAHSLQGTPVPVAKKR